MLDFIKFVCLVVLGSGRSTRIRMPRPPRNHVWGKQVDSRYTPVQQYLLVRFQDPSQPLDISPQPLDVSQPLDTSPQPVDVEGEGPRLPSAVSQFLVQAKTVCSVRWWLPRNRSPSRHSISAN